MRSLLFTAVFVLLSTVASVQAGSALGIGLGYQTASMRWSNAGNIDGCCPDQRSESSWNDLTTLYLSGLLDVTIKKKLRLLGKAGYGAIVSGDQVDSDFNQQGSEVSRAENDSSDGSVFNLSFGIGYLLLDIKDDRVGKHLRIYPKVGYAYSGQKLVMQDGQQTVPYSASINGMDDSYETEWWGPWVGVLAEFELSPNSSFDVDAEYHVAEYYGDGVRKVRDDFEHHADGVGTVVRLSYRKRQSEKWEWVIGVEFENWTIEDGTHTDYLTDGTSFERNLNDVSYKSTGFIFQNKYHF